MRALFPLGLLSLVVVGMWACGSRSGVDDGAETITGDCPGTPACARPQCGPTPVPACVNGQWTCDSSGPIEVPCDGGAGAPKHDSADGRLAKMLGDAAAVPVRDAASDAGISCGPSTCNSATQYCRVERTGLGSPDSSVNVSSANYQCPSIPTQCQATPTCACIAQLAGCSCDDQPGSFSTTQCVYP